MKKTLILVLPALIFLFVISCKKDSGSNSSSITGNWKFVSISATTQSTDQVSDGVTTYKTVTNSAYTSFNNAGTITITSNTMTSNGIAYSISDTAHAFYYENNVLIDTISQVVAFSLPSYSSASAYKQVSQDSIYFSGPGFYSDPSSGGTGGSGAHTTLTGNILKMTSYVVKDTTFNSGGYPETQHSTATAVTTLQRQ